MKMAVTTAPAEHDDGDLEDHHFKKYYSTPPPQQEEEHDVTDFDYNNDYSNYSSKEEEEERRRMRKAYMIMMRSQQRAHANSSSYPLRPAEKAQVIAHALRHGPRDDEHDIREFFVPHSTDDGQMMPTHPMAQQRLLTSKKMMPSKEGGGRSVRNNVTPITLPPPVPRGGPPPAQTMNPKLASFVAKQEAMRRELLAEVRKDIHKRSDVQKAREVELTYSFALRREFQEAASDESLRDRIFGKRNNFE